MKNKTKLKNLFFLSSLLFILNSCILFTGSDDKTNIQNSSTKEENTNISNINSIKAKKITEDLYNFPNKKVTPKKGGVLRVHMAGGVRILNPILSNSAPAGLVMGYVQDSMITQDPESFEWLPWMAYSWEIQDELLIGKKTYYGYYNKEQNKFYPNQCQVTALNQDIKENSKNNYKIKGRSYKGSKKTIHYTSVITPSFGKSMKVKDPKQVKKHVIYVFHLRKTIKWHDGVPFSADDIIFSFNIINNKYVDAAHLRNYYRDIKSISKVAPNSIKFQYKTPYFRSLSFCGGIPILAKHRYKPKRFRGDKKALAEVFNQHPDNRNPMGTGAYIFSKWEKGKYISLKKNKNYWASKAKLPYFKAGQPYLDELYFMIIPNMNTALKELSAGNLDVLLNATPSLWNDSRTTNPSFKKTMVRAKNLVPLYTYIGWNLKKPLFRDYRVRQAFTYLIPRSKILKEIHLGLGQVVTGPFFINGPIYDHSLKTKYYNPLKARALLKEAGWVDHNGDGIRDKNGVKMQFEYLIHNARDYHRKIADIIKESFEQAGIIVNIRVLDWTVFAKAVTEGNFDAFRFAWGSAVDSDPFQIWHSSQAGGGSNFIHYKNKEADEILVKARTVFDSQKRWAMYKRLHAILYKEQPYTFLFSLDSLSFYNRKFRGVKIYSSGYNFTEWFKTN